MDEMATEKLQKKTFIPVPVAIVDQLLEKRMMIQKEVKFKKKYNHPIGQ